MYLFIYLFLISYIVHNFLRIFLDSHVYTLRECLQEWVYLSNKSRNRVNDEKNINEIKLESNYVSHVNYMNNLPFNSTINGEVLINSINNCRYSVYMGKANESPLQLFSGTLYITNYRLLFESSPKPFYNIPDSKWSIPSVFKSTTIPLTCIHKIVMVQQPFQYIQIMCKDLRILQLALPISKENQIISDSYVTFLSGVAFPGINSNDLFAFHYLGLPQQTDSKDNEQLDPWGPSDLISEYNRLGLNNSNSWHVIYLFYYF